MSEAYPAIRIPRNQVSSSNVFAIGFDDEKRILAVEFKSGHVYHYANIAPELALDLVNAPSIGRFYSANIKGKFEGRRMTGKCSACGDGPGWIGDKCESCGCATYVDEPREERSNGDVP